VRGRVRGAGPGCPDDNLPIVNYYEHGTYLTSNHGHTALFGVYGMLSIFLLPLGVLQVRDSFTHGVWYARSGEFYNQPGVQLPGKLRMLPDPLRRVPPRRETVRRRAA